MIDFFFGNPRTGKTYKAMDYIYKEYLEENSKPKYNNIITNIGGFKFDKINQIFLDRGSFCRSYKLIWKQFYSHLKEMYKMAMDEADDKELNDYAYNHFINDSLIILDEASFYLKKYDDVISWWLAYHGHFKMQIMVITQGPKQIYGEYMSHTEVFYEAQAQIKQLKNNQLRYKHHHTFPFNKDSVFASSAITTNQKVYDLYKSGSIDKPKKIIYKYLFLLGIGFLFLGLVLYALFSRLSPDKVDDSSTPAAAQNISTPAAAQNIFTPAAAQNISTPAAAQNIFTPAAAQNISTPAAAQNIFTPAAAQNISYENKIYITLSCNSSHCYNNDFSLPIPLLTYFIKNNDLNLIYTNNINNNYLKLYLSSSYGFYKFLISNKGIKEDEKKSNNDSMFNGFSSSAPQSR
ncbi:MAG: hypothetical protein K0B07_05800 [DPANN group archaeon]|nr:hypothetical protein [DPANN group archaeon]